MSEILDINVTKQDGIHIISLGGRLDASSSPVAEKRLSDLIEEGARKIVVDLAGLDYISSSGMRILLAALKHIRPDGGDLVISSPKPQVREVFTLAGFNRIFGIYDDLQEAVARCHDAS